MDNLETKVDRFLQAHMEYQIGERKEAETPAADTLFLQVMATWLLAQRVKQLCERDTSAAADVDWLIPTQNDDEDE